MSHLPRSLRVFVFSWLALIACNRAIAVEPPVRIMPLGDSITFGESYYSSDVTGGYRRPLLSTLTSVSFGFNVDFVGTRTDGSTITFPDMNHEGWPGYRVDQIDAEVGNWLNQVESPDVILLHIGTNDFLQTSRNETPSGVLAELDSLINKLTTKKPYAKIIVSTLIPCTYFPNGVDVEAKQVIYNSGIPGLVAQHAALGHQVSMVDMHSALNNTSDLSDGVHPSPTGYDKMATAWRTAITNVISPKGTANRPLIAKAETTNDLTKLVVTFSKPVADTSTALSNFGISGGLTVSAASLDPVTKRTVTLTTSAQTPGEIYTLTVSGVRDRTTQQTLIAPQSKAMFYPNLLSNGSFESSYTGWPTHTGHQEIKDKTIDLFPYTTTEGNKMVAFNTGDQNPNGVLAQSFPTTVGQTYRLTYNLGIASWQYSATQKLNVNIQGSNSRLDTTSTVVGYGGSGGSPAVFWYPWSHDFTANTTTTTLTLTDDSVTDQSWSKDMLLDNVQIVRANVGPYLAVTSTPNAGASITVSPTDLGGSGGGTTGLIRSYAQGTAVTLTAPLTASGRTFQKWQLNGADIPGTNRTINITLNSNTTLNAFYDPSGTILPVAVADSYTTTEGVPLIVAAPGVLLNDSDANALPLTAALVTGPTKGSLTLNSNGGFTYTPNATGADSFTYRVNNGSQNSGNATVSLTLIPANNPPVAVNDGSAGSPYLTVAEDSGQSTSMTVLTNDSDPNGDNLTITTASSPNGSVSIVDSNKNLKFTPAANYHGATTISYTISDGNGGTANAIVYINVTSVNDLPVAVNDGSAGSPFLTVSEDSGQTASMTVLNNDSDPEGNSITIIAASSPNGSVSTSFSDTRLRFTPAANFNGATTISYTISDGNGGTASASVFITVTPVNDPPVAIAQSVATNEDTTLGITLTGSDIDGDILNTFNVTVQPLHGTLTGTGANRTYTPNANYHGPDTFSFKVSDASLQSVTAATVSITVDPFNDAPVAAVNSYSTNEDTPLVVAASGVLGNDTDPEGTTLTAVLVTNVTNGTLALAPDGGFTYTPATNFAGGDSFTYKANDGTLDSNTVTVSLTVNPVNDAPAALAQSLSVNEDTPLPITLSGTDVDSANLTFAKGSPSHGTLTGTAPNLTYTPAADYNGDDSFTFTVSDGSLTSASATVFITVNPVNDAPVAVANSYSTNEDTPLSVAASGVLGNDTDPEGTTLTAVLVTNVTNGTLALTPDGGFTYTPSANFAGGDSFTYKANDGTLDSTTVTVSLTVNPINDAPVAAANSYSTNEDTPLVVAASGVLGNDTDPEGTTLTAVLVTNVTNGTLALTPDGGFTYTPTANFTGSDSFTYKANDGALDSNTVTVSLTVDPINDAPAALAQSLSVDEDTPLPITLSGTDVDSANLTFSNSAPSHGTLTGTAPNLTYTPAANYNGDDSFTFTVTDGDLTSESATITVTVAPVNDAPVAIPQSRSVDEDQVLATTLTGTDVEGTTLTFAVSAQPAHGSVSVQGAVATYTPLPDFHGTDSFSVTASDGVATSASATVSVVVNPLDEFTQWLDAKSLVGGPTDDCDGDSISNALEFVLGGDPGQASMADLLPTTDLTTADLDAIPGGEEYLRFTYRRSGRSKIDPTTSAEVEWATSLTGPWSTADGTRGERTVTEPGDPVDHVKVYIPRSLATNGLLFTRLKVVIDLPLNASPPADE